jgi:hypothetical protein
VFEPFGYDRVVSEGFLDVVNISRKNALRPFKFGAEVENFRKSLVFLGGFYRVDDVPSKLVRIPERFSQIV